MSTVDDLPLSGLLPSKKGTKHVAIVTAVTTLGFLLTSIWELLEPVRRQPYRGVEFPDHVAYVYHVSNAISQAEGLAMFSVAIVLILLLDLPPLKRFLAAAAGSFVVTGFFGAFSGLEDALWEAYSPGRVIEPSIPYYLTEMWSGFVDGGFGSVFAIFVIAAPIYVVLLAVDRWTNLSFLD